MSFSGFTLDRGAPGRSATNAEFAKHVFVTLFDEYLNDSMLDVEFGRPLAINRREAVFGRPKSGTF